MFNGNSYLDKKVYVKARNPLQKRMYVKINDE
jgi:hypothetical protein